MVNTEFKTANFSIREFWNEAEDGPMPQDIFDNIVFTMECAQKIRTKFGKSLRVNCGWRAPAHNARIGGSKTSAHLTGSAVDFEGPTKQDNDELGALIVKMVKSGEIPCDQLIFEEFVSPDGFAWIHYSPKKDATTPPRNQFMIAEGKRPNFKYSVVTPELAKKYSIEL